MPSLDQWGRNAEERPVRTTLRALAIAIAIGILVAIAGSLISTGSLFFQGEKAKLTIGPRVQKQVYTPENAIAQIAFFHDRCQGVNGQLRTVENLQAQLAAAQRTFDATKGGDPIAETQAGQALTQAQTDLTGARNALAATVADYNSRARQSTANVFKGHGLPDQIDLPSPVPTGFTVNCG